MTGRPGIDGYLSEVAAVLPGPARARGDIIAELRSGLLDAADAYRAAGNSADEAAAAATAEFGDPRQIAAGFGPELAAQESRRLVRDLIITGPLDGLLWVAAATASHVGIRHAPPWQWRGMPPASLIAVPLFGAVLLTFVCTACFTLAATGPLTRWLHASPRTAPGTAAIAGFAAAAADLAVFILLASKLASRPGPRAGSRGGHRKPDPAHPSPARRPPLPDRMRSTQPGMTLSSRSLAQQRLVTRTWHSRATLLPMRRSSRNGWPRSRASMARRNGRIAGLPGPRDRRRPAPPGVAALLGGRGRQEPPVLRLGLAGHRPGPDRTPLPADPPQPPHRGAGVITAAIHPAPSRCPPWSRSPGSAGSQRRISKPARA